jgi:hypothetical protein
MQTMFLSIAMIVLCVFGVFGAVPNQQSLNSDSAGEQGHEIPLTSVGRQEILHRITLFHDLFGSKQFHSFLKEHRELVALGLAIDERRKAVNDVCRVLKQWSNAAQGVDPWLAMSAWENTTFKVIQKLQEYPRYCVDCDDSMIPLSSEAVVSWKNEMQGILVAYGFMRVQEMKVLDRN